MKPTFFKISVILVLWAGLFFSCDNSKKVITSENVDTSKLKKEITVNKGDTLKIKLAANPTTGYEWELASKIKPKILKFLTNPIKIAEDAEGMVGAGGTQTWFFESKKTGSVYLYFRYMRGEELGKEAYYKVTVK